MEIIEVYDNMRLKLNLNSSGIYRLDYKSAVGKTYLYKLLRSARTRDSNLCLCLTYDENLRTEDYIRLVTQTKCRIIILDRYDLFATGAVNVALVERASNTLILMDLKDRALFDVKCKILTAGITRKIDEVSVYERKNVIRR